MPELKVPSVEDEIQPINVEVFYMLDLVNPEHAHVDERLRKNLIHWLSSVRPDGRPHLVYVLMIRALEKAKP